MSWSFSRVWSLLPRSDLFEVSITDVRCSVKSLHPQPERQCLPPVHAYVPSDTSVSIQLLHSCSCLASESLTIHCSQLESQGECRHLCSPSLRDHSPTMPMVQCLKTIVSCNMSRKFVGEGQVQYLVLHHCQSRTAPLQF